MSGFSLPVLAGLIGAIELALSVIIFAQLSRAMPRWLAAIAAPVLVLAAGFAYGVIAAMNLPPDGYSLHILMLASPFALGITLPIVAVLLLWVVLTHRRGRP